VPSATVKRRISSEGEVETLDARVALVLLLSLLTLLALISSPSYAQLAIYLAFLLASHYMSGISALHALRGSLLVVPFVGLFALLVLLSGETHRAWVILVKSYLSALTVLTCVSITPVHRLLSAAKFFRFPTLLVEVTQVLYRYLFVLRSESAAMQRSFNSRLGRRGPLHFLASSRMIAILFHRSYERALVINQAMASRGFTGTLPLISTKNLGPRDFVALGLGLLLVLGLPFVS
jgi:cobalt/nickel transport system permease protein